MEPGKKHTRLAEPPAITLSLIIHQLFGRPSQRRPVSQQQQKKKRLQEHRGELLFHIIGQD